MKESVIITESSYRKGRSVFDQYRDTVEWILTEGDEEIVARELKKSNARIAVLGVNPYRDSLYRALSENSRGDHALIARFGVGFDGIDTARCRELNIFVTITPGTLEQSVAEHTIALLLSVARNIPESNRKTREGAFGATPGFELKGRSLGIAGMGRIGRRVASIAAGGFCMKVYGFDCISVEEQAKLQGVSVERFLKDFGIELYTRDFQEFARSVDIISIHMPTDDSTRDFFDKRRLGMLHKGTILINTSRGALINETDLFEALSTHKIKAAALDVFSKEPYEPVSPDCDLRQLDNIIMTPHIASNTVEANNNMAAKVMLNIKNFLDGGFDDLTKAEP